MAANAQLKDYISQQTKLGVSKDVIKSALVGAGWNEADINQAFAESETVSQPAVSMPAQQVQPTIQVTKPTEAATKPSPVSFMASDIFQPKGEPVFQAKSGSQPGIVGIKTDAAPSVAKIEHAGREGLILAISLGVLSAILLGGNVYFFMQNRALNSKIAALSSGNSSSENQITTLTADKKNLADQVDLMNKTITDLGNQLSIFSAPASGSSAEVSFDVSGVLSGGGKVPYSITTNRNIILSVKNYKDAAVDAALKNLAGTSVRLEGTHQPGSVQLNVAAVNGQPVQQPAQPAAKATSTTGTGTGTSAATTTTP